jgi:predicted MPP superfamily phosphohydrolase
MTVTFVVAIAVLLGLLLFLHNEVRRPPGPAQWGRVPGWTKLLRVAFAAIVLFVAGCVFWGFFIEPGRLVIREETIQLDNWPQPLDGLRIAVLSDLHVDNWFITEKKLRTIVERTNQQQPELIVILGDFISGEGRVPERVEPEVFAPVLKELLAPLGVFAVLGNHDWWYEGARVRQVLEQNGIKVLEDQSAKVDARGTSFWLVGLADLWTRAQRIAGTVAKVPEGQPLIGLTHNPDIFPNLPQRVQLLLAGHTHGGQVRFPIIGPVIQSSEYGWVHGHVFANNHHLFVTTGIGTSIIPVRFGLPPEIVILTLKSGSHN